MQLAELVVEGLFGKYDHKVLLPTSGEDEAEPSVVILHGPNGVGKTTILRMLSGMIKLDFNLFRSVPFRRAYIGFNAGQRLTVSRTDDDKALLIDFDGSSVLLHPQHGGPFREQDAEAVQEFQQKFRDATESLTYEYLSANRIQPGADPDSPPDAARAAQRTLASIGGVAANYERLLYQSHLVAEGLKPPELPSKLAKSVQKFIGDAQLDHAAFFRPSEPDLFIKIIDDLARATAPPMQVDEIRQILGRVQQLDAVHIRLGLGTDRWDFDRLMGLLSDKGDALDEHTLAVLGTYTEFLSSRSTNRQLVAERLLTFEEVMAEFLTGKELRVDARKGFTIVTEDEHSLDESELSSGEYQLLYLMVAALTTRRRGTVIAIDEPELSMHIAWQRRLVPSLIRCASRAAPQLILATHSPEIAAGYPESMVELGAQS